MKKLLYSILVIIATSYSAISQTYLYFQDSPTRRFYDFSWMDVTSPSTLERLGTDLRKFPVEENIESAQGVNSLRLTWRSIAGGDWLAIAAGLDWTAKDISQADSLLFFVYSSEGIAVTNLPRVFMEDESNRKSTRMDISLYTDDIVAMTWTRIAIPMNDIRNSSPAVDFTKIKTVGFAQGAADNQEHTMLIDDVRVFAGSGVSPIASVPTGVVATGYDSHIEIIWNKNPEDDINGYQIQRSLDGTTFKTIGVTQALDTGYIDWVWPLGHQVKPIYRVASVNASNQVSAYSDTTTASTREFTDEELLDMVQQYTFRYFYDFAHPVSGLARERNTSGDIVTSGGSGFGIMALLVGIERGFITREQGLSRMQKITAFLDTADRFHGAWAHWMNGNTGEVVPFSEFDDGGDLVETAFLAQGLLTARQYFDGENIEEEQLRDSITSLWESIEWDWYARDNSDVLYWHWSPNYGWQMNMQIRGWNEAAIAYILAVASPTNPVAPTLWQTGWAGQPYYINGKSFYGYKLDVGWDNGGPLFFAHYSFQGFDPRNIKDQYTNYFNLNRNHTLIHRAYAIANPKNHPGYGENSWGLTASDDHIGYAAHEPGNPDNGTIAPTAAISSMPYTPEESIAALKHFYRELGERLWGRMGFHDAFNIRENWYASSYLAIDQGPIINMIENYRSALLWSNFMSNPEISPALESIGFTGDPNAISESENRLLLQTRPNPASDLVQLNFTLENRIRARIVVSDNLGKNVLVPLKDANLEAGSNIIDIDIKGLKSGFYYINLYDSQVLKGTAKLIVR